MILKLLEHAAWADDRARTSIASLGVDMPQRAEATRLYAHLAGAEHAWLTRVEERPSVHAIWPDLSLDDAAALASETIAGFRAIATRGPETLAREIGYRNSSGQAFRNSVADIITHVALHGSYHRGQIALLARSGGAAPLPTDYIAFVRGVTPVSPSR